jgi:hypothetical protein
MSPVNPAGPFMSAAVPPASNEEDASYISDAIGFSVAMSYPDFGFAGWNSLSTKAIFLSPAVVREFIVDEFVDLEISARHAAKPGGRVNCLISTTDNRMLNRHHLKGNTAQNGH